VEAGGEISLKSVYTLEPDQPFNLDVTLSCGQVFRWEKNGDLWTGVSAGRMIGIRQSGREIEYSGCDEEYLEYLFHLDFDLESAIGSFSTDEHIGEAVERYRGLRVMRQDPWECLLSYLCAQNTGIPNIKRMLGNMAVMNGKKIASGGQEAYAFPWADDLSRCCDSDLKGCSTGYRSGYICRTSSVIAEDPGWSDRIRSLDYKGARKEIMKYPGVGRKVADCILLFGFQFYESFPVDVWIRRIMNDLYGTGNPAGPLSERDYDRIADFGREHFGNYAGYAQEYLFAGRQ
jgi:N-glycosylase/DNA lyase